MDRNVVTPAMAIRLARARPGRMTHATQPSAAKRAQHAIARARAAAKLGRAAEDVAARHLISQGLLIVQRNFRRRLGEIDLVARDGNVVVIVEVRTRSSDKYGGAAASIDGRKQARIVRASRLLLQMHREYARAPVRFDVIIVHDALAETPRVQWIKHAFLAT
jgi:putative endonuclease